jgi:putative ABC transport system substrate-binding protein
MMADLIHRQVAVIAATTTEVALAAKAATTTIPIVFEMASDPVRVGLVAHLNRPGGNATGVTNTNLEIVPKRLQLLHELVPTASAVALLANPANPALAEAYTRLSQATARTLGLELHILNASNERDLDGVFAKLIQLRAGGLVIGVDPLFTGAGEQLAVLSVHHAVPTIYQGRNFAVAGGLLSYGGDTTDAYRLTGIYVGRVLKGEKPGRPTGSAGDQSRTVHQPQDRHDAGHHCADFTAWPRRRGDRIAILFAAQHESAYGTEVECAPEGGQFQAAFLTDCWAWRSSYCAGLR